MYFLITENREVGNYQAPDAVSCDDIYQQLIPEEAPPHYHPETLIPQHSCCRQIHSYCPIWFIFLEAYFASAPPRSPKAIYFFLITIKGNFLCRI